MDETRQGHTLIPLSFSAEVLDRRKWASALTGGARMMDRRTIAAGMLSCSAHFSRLLASCRSFHRCSAEAPDAHDRIPESLCTRRRAVDLWTALRGLLRACRAYRRQNPEGRKGGR